MFRPLTSTVAFTALAVLIVFEQIECAVSQRVFGDRYLLKDLRRGKRDYELGWGCRRA